jgi:UDP-N-acetylglucosamine:LPS N-acetylglucosamine transferase
MKAKPPVLLLSATSGAGHVRAGQALEKAFAARGLDPPNAAATIAEGALRLLN